jgi:hypothetical protein
MVEATQEYQQTQQRQAGLWDLHLALVNLNLKVLTVLPSGINNSKAQK